MFTELNDAPGRAGCDDHRRRARAAGRGDRCRRAEPEAYAFEGGEVASDAFWEVRGPDDVSEFGYGQALHAFPQANTASLPAWARRKSRRH